MDTIYGQGGKLGRIASFLREHDGFWCNSCLERALEFPNSAKTDVLTRQMGRARRYYQRAEREICSGCEDTRTCIRSAA